MSTILFNQYYKSLFQTAYCAFNSSFLHKKAVTHSCIKENAIKSSKIFSQEVVNLFVAFVLVVLATAFFKETKE